MKLIVQIPCYNEETTLAETVRDIPRNIPGIDTVEILVIDDGCSDRTIEIARQAGVDHIISNAINMGLASSFRRGLDTCLKLGADIIVNTDGDNQYAGGDIPKLIEPILSGKAELVIGDRQTAAIPHFSPTKKLLQSLGSLVVRRLSGIDVPDAVSGFRAISREAAIKLNIISSYSYTIEMIIQAGKKQISVAHVRVNTNPPTRESRLFSSIFKFIELQLSIMIRMYAMYKPLRVFIYISLALSLIGFIPILRFLYFYLVGQGEGHIQSVVLGGVFLSMGFIAFLVGLLADLISRNRQLIEINLEKTKRLELEKQRNNKNASKNN